jgi:3-dehydroquinate synthase
MAPAALEIVFPGRTEKCSVLFGEKLIDRLPVERFSEASSLAIVTDDIVARLYAGKLQELLSRVTKIHVVVMRHGERNKNLPTASMVAKKLSVAGLDRKSMILALGGGVVGDLTGFVASIYKRGIKYFQIPTTLLAQVDSSIGGKCGIDTDWGKNQIGTFYQPVCVFVDSSVLDTLPQKEIINGLGEIVKSCIIADRRMFDEISSGLEDFYSIQRLKTLVRRTCETKAKVVEKDERESSVRKILNYGHTMGHAIEASSNFRISHGKSVILGMICEGWIAHKLGIFEDRDFARQEDLLLKIKTHYKIRSELDYKRISYFASLDKKNIAGATRLSVPEKIGKMHPGEDGGYAIPVSRDLLSQSLDYLKVS